MTQTDPQQPSPPNPYPTPGEPPAEGAAHPPGRWYAQPLNLIALAVVAVCVAVAVVAATRWVESRRPPTDPAAVEADAAKAVAVRYARAMAAGDVATLAEVSTGDDASLRLLVAQAKKDAAYERLATLARQKFGDDASVRLGGVRARDLGANLVGAVAASPAELSPNGQARVGGIALRKVNGDWRVDRDRVVPPGDDVAGPIAMLDALRGGYDTIAAALREGRVESADEAKEMFEEQTRAAVRAAAGPVTTRPATTRPVMVPVPRPPTTRAAAP